MCVVVSCSRRRRRCTVTHFTFCTCHRYLGGAHGLSGIILALLDAHAFIQFPPEYLNKIRATIEYIHSLKLPTNNYPTRPHQTPGTDKLMQWCHGAPGPLLMFVRAYELLEDARYVCDVPGQCYNACTRLKALSGMYVCIYVCMYVCTQVFSMGRRSIRCCVEERIAKERQRSLSWNQW